MTDIGSEDRPVLAEAPISAGLTQLAARFAVQASAFPAEVVEIAKLSIFDWFVVLHAGSAEPVSDVVRAVVRHERTQGESRAISLEAPVSARSASYVNGTVSHALDYDDTHFGMVGHPTVAVFPAVLAVAQEEGLSGRRLLDAFIIGVETSCRLGSYFGRRHYGAGFHQTATSGTFGATAGVSRLLGLDEDQTRHALGFASTRASGLRSQFGTMGKPIHAGMAASNGVEAARLAAFGGVSRPDGIECVEGFEETHQSGGGPVPDMYGPEAPFQLSDLKYKFHACCHGTHGPLEAALIAKSELVGGADAVSRVILTVNPQWTNICCIPEPKTGLEVKFSLATVIAMALLGVDTASPASFTDALCDDLAVTALARRVDIVFQPDMPDTMTLAVVELTSGKRIEVTYDLMEPVGRDVLADKLRRKAKALLGADHAASLWAFVERLETLDSNALSRALRQRL
ncbi:MAG: MmgE/PrpD family protein [Brevundimonas sp.]|jgi:2-methylcitrate dehydratase PrpD|uniref:MmgE/PrpD family protein n=1 Tax=Brevundimonas sp. TaxID=1871086 RepID=UPI0025BC7B1F|nr:MmgE/PrpD family protein [Brevundimonas sp.]MCH4269688.1 MmgE/PrpD family protein [Brevundimonas sp.]